MSSIPLKVTAYVLTMLALVGMCGLVVAWARSTGGNGGRLRSTSADVGTTVEWGNKVKPEEPKDYENRILVQFSESQRFGIVCPKLRDPRNLEEPKRLTRDARGITNNTCVRIDGYEYLYGIEIPGVRYVRERGKVLGTIDIGQGSFRWMPAHGKLGLKRIPWRKIYNALNEYY